VQSTRAVALAPPLVVEGAEVRLDGDPSTGSGLTYAWADDCACVVLDATASAPRFTAPTLTGDDDFRTITFTLTVTDDSGAADTTAAAVTVYDQNQRPRAAVTTADTVVRAGESVSLTAAGAKDEDGEIVAYDWAQIDGPAASLVGTREQVVTFVAPDVQDIRTLTLRLSVVDDEGKKGRAERKVVVHPVAAALTITPATRSAAETALRWEPPLRVLVKNAAGNLIVGGDAAELDVSLSVPATAKAALLGTTTRRARAGEAVFPDLSYRATESLVVTASVLAGTILAQVTQVVEESHPAPVVVAPADQSVDAGTLVALQGTATDDGALATVAWAQLLGPAIETAADAALLSFTAPIVATPTVLEFRLSATDEGGKETSDTVQVTVNPVATALAFVALPPRVVVGQRWPAVQVELKNALGTRIIGGAAATAEVSVKLGAGELEGTTTRTSAFGLASFLDLSFGEVQAVLHVTAQSGDLAVVGNPFPSAAVLPGSLGAAAERAESAVAAGFAGGLLLATRFGGAVDLALAPRAEHTQPAGAAVARLSPAGATIWSRSLADAGGSLEVRSVAPAAERALVAGVVELTSASSLGLVKHGGADAFFGVLDMADANNLKLVSMGDDLADGAYGAAWIDAQHFVVAGAFAGHEVPLDVCGGHVTDAVDTDGWVAAYDVALDCAGDPVLWAHPISAPGRVAIDALAADSDHVWAAGTFAEGFDTVPGAGLFVLQLAAADGAVQWSSVVSAGAPHVAGLAKWNDAIYVAGHFSGALQGEPARGRRDGFLLRLEDGVVAWTETFGPTGGAAAVRVHAIYAGEALSLAGDYRGEVTLADRTSTGFLDGHGFVAAFDATGTLQSSQSLATLDPRGAVTVTALADFGEGPWRIGLVEASPGKEGDLPPLRGARDVFIVAP
jgi:hypothetical protein